MNNLRNLRKKKGYSIRQLHEMTGIPQRSLEEWDGEKRQIQAYHRIKRLAAVLGCTTDNLMTKEEKCLYGDARAVICLVQEEDGVCVDVYTNDDMVLLVHYATIPREKALALLDHIKANKDVKQFFAEE